MNRVTFTVVGYLLVLIGFISLILGMIGLSLQPLVWIDRLLGQLGSFLVKLLMVVFGMIVLYMSRVSHED